MRRVTGCPTPLAHRFRNGVMRRTSHGDMHIPREPSDLKELCRAATAVRDSCQERASTHVCFQKPSHLPETKRGCTKSQDHLRLGEQWRHQHASEKSTSTNAYITQLHHFSRMPASSCGLLHRGAPGPADVAPGSSWWGLGIQHGRHPAGESGGARRTRWYA